MNNNADNSRKVKKVMILVILQENKLVIEILPIEG